MSMSHTILQPFSPSAKQVCVWHVCLYALTSNSVMNDYLVQNGVMNEKFVKNFVMDAKIDPKVVMDLSMNSLQTSKQKLLEEFIDENEPWLLIGIPS